MRFFSIKEKKALFDSCSSCLKIAETIIRPQHQSKSDGISNVVLTLTELMTTLLKKVKMIIFSESSEGQKIESVADFLIFNDSETINKMVSM